MSGLFMSKPLCKLNFELYEPRPAHLCEMFHFLRPHQFTYYGKILYH